jgi:xanthine dehydrogenase YagS FAD-binding subunit
MKSFAWVQAATVEQALAELKQGAVVQAGGVDLVDRMKEGIAAPPRVVSIRGVAGLGAAAERDDGLHLGATITLGELAELPALRKRWAAVAEAAAHAATPQIRNMATLGGNLVQRPRCWYFRSAEFACRKKGGETCFAQHGENQYHAIFRHEACAIVHPSSLATALVALDARATLRGPAGSREVALEEFFRPADEDVTRENSLGDGELLTEVRLPPTGSRSAYLKQGEKESFDWPIADVAVALELAGGVCRRASIVLGAAASIPWRAAAAEKLLAGRGVDEGAARAAAEAALQGAKPMSKNAYKLPVFRAVIARAILAAAGGAT